MPTAGSAAPKSAFVPGSFDPFHNGHLAVVEAAAQLFGRVIVGVGHNPAKPSGLFSPAERIALVEAATAHLDNVATQPFTGLVTTAAREAGADCLVKGIRTGSDLDVEMVQANTNRATGGIQTVFLPGLGEAALVASRYLREIGIRGGDISSLVPESVSTAMRGKAVPESQETEGLSEP